MVLSKRWRSSDSRLVASSSASLAASTANWRSFANIAS